MPSLFARCSAPLTVTVSLLAGLAPAQSPTQAAAGRPGAPAAHVLPPAPGRAAAAPFVETLPDGTVWARGADWKASFTAAGVQFVPFLGSDAPRNFPLALQLAGASVGAAAVAVDLEQPPSVRGPRVELARGACVEAYELRAGGIEQTFTFARALRGGALQVRMHVATELAAASDGAGGFRFANELGGVHYGRAIAFDANARTTPVVSTCDGQSLTLTVPAEFVASATFPLTIDPLVSTFGLTPNANLLDESNADCAYVGTFNGLYVSVVEEHYSQTDHDVLALARDRDGNVVTSSYVDYTVDYWATPAVASHRGASQFLVVASKGAPTSTARTVWGRTLTWSGGPTLAASAQFPIHQFGSGKNPDVGGDPNPSPPLPGNYCVTWEGTNDGELYYNIVRTDASLWSTNGLWLDPGSEFVSNPAISKSCGVGATSTQEWIIVWQKRYSPTDEDIHGTRIAQNGTVLTLDFLIDYSGLSDSDPEVSSLTDTTGGGVERFAVVYERDFPGTPLTPAHRDVMGQAYAGTTSLSGTVNLTSLLNGSIFDNHYAPCIDTDGQRFALGFTRWGSIFSADTEPFLATLHLVNGTFAVTAYPELLNGYHGPDERLRVTSERSGGTFTPRYMATWQTEHVATPPSGADGHGAFYYGHSDIPPTSWFVTTLPGCGTLQLSGSGRPALAQVFTLDLTGASGIPFLMFGDYLANPFHVCASCILGVDSTTAIFVQTSSLPVFVPPDVGLIDQIFGAQGLDLFAPSGCSQPFDFTLSNTVLITLL